MANGKPGDHPLADILIHNLTVYGQEGDDLTVDDVLRGSAYYNSEFVRWFDTDTAGPQEHYKSIASEIWQLWQEHLADNSKSDPPRGKLTFRTQ